MKTYKIESGDTLQSISEKFGITPVELKAFHNTHCDLKDLIGGNDLPKHLNEILIDENWKEVSKNPNEKVVFYLENFEDQKFICNQTTQVLINGGELSNFKQYQKFNLGFEKKDYTYTLNVVENGISDNLELSEKFDGLLEEIVKLKDILQLKVDERGQMIKIVNKKELRDNWELLKEKLKDNNTLKDLPISNYNEMIKKGDLEFSDNYPLIDELKNSIFHSNLFYPIYNQKFSLGSNSNLDKSYTNSSLFPEVLIPISSTLFLVDYNEKNEYILRIESQIDKSKINYSYLEKIYSKTYPFLMDKLTKYNLEINRIFSLDKETSQLNFIDVEILETVNNNLEAYQNLEIEKINKYES